MRGPRIYAPRAFKIPEIETITLPNGLRLYYLDGGSSNTVKFEWSFRSGRSSEKILLASKMCHSLMKEGTLSSTGYEVAEHFDFYGSSLNQSAGVDYSSCSFFCLGQYFEPLLEKLLEVVTTPSFPEHELEILKSNSIAKLNQDLDDADFVAYRILTEAAFGTLHPYGYNSTESLIRQVQREDIIQHYNINYLNTNGFVMVSGDLSEKRRAFIESLLSSCRLDVVPVMDPPSSPDVYRFYLEDKKQGKNQCSFKLGQRCIQRDYPDYNAFFVFNALLGGYFNARLSKVIREQKGLTYNIYSTHDTYLYDGMFYISAETSWQNLAPLQKEVYRQLDVMLQKPVPKAELERVRAYLMGLLITSFDGVFTCADTFRSCLAEGVSFDSLQGLIDTVAEISPQEVWDRSVSHVDINNLIEIVIG